MATLNYKILPTRRKSSGKLGIYLSLTYKKQVRYISTEFEIDDEYQFENGKVCYMKDSAKINKRMDFVISEYMEKLSQVDLKKFSSCSQLKDRLVNSQNPDNSLTIKSLFEKRIVQLIKEHRESYSKMNKYSMNVILDIIGDTPIEYITRLDIKRLHQAMQRKGFAPGNIQMRMTHLKAAINEAIDDGYVSYTEHPFKGYTMPQSQAKLIDVTIDQFVKIVNLNTNQKTLSLARDMFLLSVYLGGINLADLISVNLSGDTLSYIRKKSKDHKEGEKHTVFIIQPEAREIIQRYIDTTGKLNLYNISSSYENLRRYINKCMKKLASEIGIISPFSFYSGRKTFAQFSFDLGIKTEVIEYCIGQSVKKNRPIYNYVRVMQRQADAAIRKVIDYTLNPSMFIIE